MADPSLLRQLGGISSVGAAVEFSWAAGESVLVPFLTRHGVPDWLVSMAYLANPTLGLYVQPRIGAWSDRLNKRVPFVLGLTGVALLGMVMLMSAVPIAAALGLTSAAAVATAFVGFGVADICYDCLLIPGRALLDDATPAGKANDANSLFTAFQLGGRLLALLLGASQWSAGGLGGLYHGEDAHFNSMLSLSFIFLVTATATAVLSADDVGAVRAGNAHARDLPPGPDPDTSESEPMHRPPPDDAGSDDDGGGGDGRRLPHDVPLLPPDPTPLRRAVADRGAMRPAGAGCCGLLGLTTGERVLCAIQATGWLGICAQSFFWTSWRGEKQGCADLAAQSVVGILTAWALPWANERWGTATVWCSSEVFFSALLIAVAFTEDGDGGDAAMVLGALTGVNYAIHATNALLVAADIAVDPSKRAGTIAMVNNTLPAGQLATALLGGAIASELGGFKWVFVSFGVVGLLATSFAWSVAARDGLFVSKRLLE